MLLPALTAVGGTLASTLAQTAAQTNTASNTSPSFETTLAQIGADAAKTLHDGEAAALAGAAGKIPVQQVVDSVMAAERTLQTGIALRDKAVQAYHDIINMAI